MLPTQSVDRAKAATGCKTCGSSGEIPSAVSERKVPCPDCKACSSAKRCGTDELARLVGECPQCESCGHVQAEPNWCHLCGHRTSTPAWAERLLAELAAERAAKENYQDGLIELRDRIAALGF